MGRTIDDEHCTEIERFVTEWLSDHRIPGAAVSIVDGDGLVYDEGFGARALDENEPATSETLFGIGSCTKSVTATAVMQLVAAGDIDVDDPVDEYITHLEGAPGEPITIRELLTHTSGIPSDGMAGPLITRQIGVRHLEVPLSSRDDFRRHVEGSIDRRVTDRETFFYYNSGYTMLGFVVEAVTGMVYADYVREHLLDPLRMSRSGFSREEFEARSDRMTPYVKQEGDSRETGFPFEPLIHAPGGLLSSVTELANYVQMLINGGVFENSVILKQDLVNEMTRGELAFGTYYDGREVEYGYGLKRQEFLGDTLIGHGGSIAVSNAWFGYLEEAQIGVVVACTSSPDVHPMAIGPAILAILSNEEPTEAVPQLRLSDVLDEVTGEYTTYRDTASATVERSEGTLTLTQKAGTGSQELHMTVESIDEDRLVCSTTTARGLQYPVRFELGHDVVHLYFERSRFTKA